MVEEAKDTRQTARNSASRQVYSAPELFAYMVCFSIREYEQNHGRNATERENVAVRVFVRFINSSDGLSWAPGR